MSDTEALHLLRPGLLDGARILLAGAPPSAPGAVGHAAVAGASPAAAVREACVALGAQVRTCAVAGEGSDGDAIEDAIEQAIEELGGIELLVVDGAALFALAYAARGPRNALVGCLDESWSVTRAVANRVFIARQAGGRIILLSPAPTAGAHADAARAALENLARTLSIEWARYAITTVAIAPGAATTSGEVAALTAYLASPAGAYFSGCSMDLGARVAAVA